jgi:hypothetical protein
MPIDQVSQKYPPVLLNGTVNELACGLKAPPSLSGTEVNGKTSLPLVRLPPRTAQKHSGLSGHVQAHKAWLTLFYKR